MIDESGSFKVGELLSWLAIAVVSLLTFLGRRQIARVDEHDGRLAELEKKAITKDDITSMEQRLTSVIQTGQQHVAERIGDVRSTAEKAHARLDDLMKQH